MSFYFQDDAEFMKADDYDILVNELKYETKAKVCRSIHEKLVNNKSHFPET